MAKAEVSANVRGVTSVSSDADGGASGLANSNFSFIPFSSAVVSGDVWGGLSNDGIPLFVEEMTKAVLEAENEGATARAVAAIPSPSVVARQQIKTRVAKPGLEDLASQLVTKSRP